MNKSNLNKTILIFLILLNAFFNNACRDTISIEPESKEFIYSVPITTTDGWETGSLEDAGIYSDEITDMINYLDNETNHRIHSILIVKDSKLVFEKYFSGYKFDINTVQSPDDLVNYGIDTLHYLASISKSITSLLLGIAIDHGAEINISDSLLAYYPEYDSILVGEKIHINVGHLLTMSAGLRWDESTYNYGNPKNDVTQLFLQQDPIKFILEKSIEYLPGTKFSYNSGYTNILADILQNQTATQFLAFAENLLFNKLGIVDYNWEQINSNLAFASGGLYLSSRSLAKIGSIYLNRGKWKEMNIVSENWIDESLQSYMNPNYYYFSDGYGYHWWKNTFHTINGSYECFFAAGWGEQFLYLFPDLNMLVVFTSGYYFDDQIDISPHSILNDYILYALKPIDN